MITKHFDLEGVAVCHDRTVLSDEQLTTIAEQVTCERCLVLVGAQMLDTLGSVFRALAASVVKKS